MGSNFLNKKSLKNKTGAGKKSEKLHDLLSNLTRIRRFVKIKLFIFCNCNITTHCYKSAHHFLYNEQIRDRVEHQFRTEKSLFQDLILNILTKTTREMLKNCFLSKLHIQMKSNFDSLKSFKIVQNIDTNQVNPLNLLVHNFVFYFSFSF